MTTCKKENLQFHESDIPSYKKFLNRDSPTFLSSKSNVDIPYFDLSQTAGKSGKKQLGVNSAESWYMDINEQLMCGQLALIFYPNPQKSAYDFGYVRNWQQEIVFSIDMS